MEDDSDAAEVVVEGHFGFSIKTKRTQHTIPAAIDEASMDDAIELSTSSSSGGGGGVIVDIYDGVQEDVVQLKPSHQICVDAQQDSNPNKVMPTTAAKNATSPRSKRSKSLNYVIPKVRLAATQPTICEKRRFTLSEPNATELLLRMPVAALTAVKLKSHSRSSLFAPKRAAGTLESDPDMGKKLELLPQLTSPKRKSRNDLNSMDNGPINAMGDPADGIDKTPEKSPSATGNDIEKSLLCNEEILTCSPTASTSSGASSLAAKLASPDEKSPPTDHLLSDVNSFSSMLNMVSTYNMLTWKERIGTARGTPMRFQLNEFNLLEIHERCSPRYQIHLAYEKPIYDRETIKSLGSNVSGGTDPQLYLCRRCNCHGSANDFLAPGFCSLKCLKRNSRKRQRQGHTMPASKSARKEAIAATSPSVLKPPKLEPANNKNNKQTQQQQQQQPVTASSHPDKQIFRWSTYLQGIYHNVAAPIDHFLNPFPTGPNPFELGMKLEAIDPENCSLFCVCTVVEIRGYRLKLSFDGFESMYDFWVNADSMDIFPPGWCEKTHRLLQPPKGVPLGKFNWSTYLEKQKAVPAHRQLFTHLNSSTLPSRNSFVEGMHLEAEDLNDTGKLCVATVADVLDDRIRVHFDGWDSCYDYWVDISSPYIHPCGWHEGRQQLIVPPEFENFSFTWAEYIKQRKTGIAAPDQLFEARDPIDFKPHMKLEVVDPRTPLLIRPATVIARKGHRIKLHFDCWAPEYCFWIEDDSPDLHPIGWCDATGHDLEPPPGYNSRPILATCAIQGCRGIGNAKCFYLSTHNTRDCCPYATENWRQKVEKPPRVNNDVVQRTPMAQPMAAKGPTPYPKTYKTSQITRKMQLLNILGTSSHDQRRTRQHDEESAVAPKIALCREEQRSKEMNEHSVVCLVTPKEEDNDDDSIANNELATDSNCHSAAANLLPPEISIARRYLADYGPRLKQNYKIWQKNLNVDESHMKGNPLKWTTTEASAFVLQTIDCCSTAKVFEREDIDGIALLMLQQSDLTDLLGLRLGPAVKLFAHIVHLRTLVCRKFKTTSVPEQMGQV